MDVRCERCRAQYVLDDEQVTAAGLPVQCTNCGHVFRVKKKELVVTIPLKPGEIDGAPLPASAVAPRSGDAPSAPHPPAPLHGFDRERPREWLVRQASGGVVTFRDLTTLQRWIVERKVSRDDEVAQSGDPWRRLGDVPELSSFFAVVEAAERATPGGGIASPGGAPEREGTGPAAGASPSPPLAHEVDLGPPSEPPPAPAPRGRPARAAAIAAVLAFALGGFATAAYLHPASPLRARRAPPSGSAAAASEASPAASTPAPPSQPAAAVAPVPGPAPELSGAPAPEATPSPAVSGSEPRTEGAAVPAGGAAQGPEHGASPAADGPPGAAVAAAAPPGPNGVSGAAAAAEGPGPDGPPGAAVAAAAPPAPDGPPAMAVATAAPPARVGPKVLLAQAHRLRERGDVRAALELYDRIVAYDPGNAEALTGRGLCYLDLERYLPAEASFEAALRIEPRHPDALLGLAETYRFEGKRPEAIRQYERYLAEHPAGDEADVARNAIEELRK